MSNNSYKLNWFYEYNLPEVNNTKIFSCTVHKRVLMVVLKNNRKSLGKYKWGGLIFNQKATPHRFFLGILWNSELPRTILSDYLWSSLLFKIHSSFYGTNDFSTYAKFPEKLTFLTPWYAHVRVHIWEYEMLIFRRTLRTS